MLQFSKFVNYKTHDRLAKSDPSATHTQTNTTDHSLPTEALKEAVAQKNLQALSEKYKYEPVNDDGNWISFFIGDGIRPQEEQLSEDSDKVIQLDQSAPEANENTSNLERIFQEMIAEDKQSVYPW